MRLPLTVHVGFKAKLRAENRVQIPRSIRWEHRLDPEHVLRVRVKLADAIGGGEEFYGRIRRDGRLAIPRLVMNLLCSNYDQKSLIGEVFEVSLEPAKA